MYSGTNGRMSMDRLGGINWDRMRTYRLGRVKESMKKFGIDVLIKGMQILLDALPVQSGTVRGAAC